MASPLPGMDPYLEDAALWPAFQHHLVTCLYQFLLPGLVDRYRARVGQRHYTTDEGQEQHEEHIEIRSRGDGRLVTLLDVVSPVNKTTAAGRQAYLDKRQEGRKAGANLVEIDLVLQGQPTLEHSRDGLPEWDYAVTVTRATPPERLEIYPTTLQKKLPRFRLPLAADDRDTVVDLQAAFSRCFDQGGFGKRIDYGREPSVPLSDADRSWLVDCLQAQRVIPAGLRELTLPHEKIAQVAYAIWQQEGCPHGRDQEHWHRAVEQLKSKATTVLATS